MLPNKIIIVSIFAGVITAIFSGAIDSIFATFITKKHTESIGEIIKKCLLLGCTGGLLVSVILYYFASTDTAPIRMIVTYSIMVGTVSPILSNLLVFAYSKLFNGE